MRLPTFKRFALWSIPGALLIGICLSFIKWGDHTGGHGLYGQGIPIPSVMWDNPPRYGGRFVDYINPLAVIENPVAIYLCNILAFGLLKAGSALLSNYSTKKY